MVFEGLVGSMSRSPGGFSEPDLLSSGVCEREAGNEGLTNPSLFVDAVKLLLTELAVSGRSSCVIVALLWLDVGLERGLGEFSLLRLLGRDTPTVVLTILPSARGVLGS